jgi:vacuolar protein sorting-associated protein 13D
MLVHVEHSMQQNLTHLFQSTTVVSYHPILADKPLSCNLNHCEMFSCILGMEDETALSIIDPVTVNMDVTHQLRSGTTRGIPDATVSPTDKVLEVSHHLFN